MVEDRKTNTEVELITPIELSDQELDLVTGGSGVATGLEQVVEHAPPETLLRIGGRVRADANA